MQGPARAIAFQIVVDLARLLDGLLAQGKRQSVVARPERSSRSQKARVSSTAENSLARSFALISVMVLKKTLEKSAMVVAPEDQARKRNAGSVVWRQLHHGDPLRVALKALPRGLNVSVTWRRCGRLSFRDAGARGAGRQNSDDVAAIAVPCGQIGRWRIPCRADWTS